MHTHTAIEAQDLDRTQQIRSLISEYRRMARIHRYRARTARSPEAFALHTLFAEEASILADGLAGLEAL